MNKKIISKIVNITLVLLMVGAMFASLPNGANAATTIYVPDQYPTIQAAVDAASPGDTIIVRNGTYTENVDVNKAHLIIQSQNGADATTVQAANSGDHVFEVRADYVVISGFTTKGATEDWTAGIHLRGVDSDSAGHCKISHNTVCDNNYGVWLRDSSNNTLTNNRALDNDIGMYVGRSSNNNILDNNTASNNYLGIYLFAYPNNNILTNNTASNNYDWGIFLSGSSNNTLIGNTMLDNLRNFGVSGLKLSDYIHNIDTSNKVNGKPIQYLIDRQNLVIDSSWNVGYLGIVNCTNIIVKDLTLANNGEGVLFAYSSDSRIESVNTSGNGCAISLRYSSNNTLNNNVASNNFVGIHLWCSSSNTLTNNTMLDNLYNFRVGGLKLSDYIHNIDTSNKVNGKPIQYLVDRQNLVIDSSWNVGYLGIVNCTNIIVKDLTLANNGEGVLFAYSSDSRIESVTALDNIRGIHLEHSSNNIIYLNNFINNYDNAFSYESTNTWNSPEKITYTYNDNTYTSYLGNYWDDYTGSDADGDGIGEVPYSIDGDSDNYPLKEPFEDYETESSTIPVLQWPLAGEIENRQILLGFGDIWTWTYCGGLPKKHTGVDLKASIGEDVYVAYDGKIVKIYNLSSIHNWGKGIVIEHSGFTTAYMHVNTILEEGDYVNKGQKISTIANIDGDEHLHFGVRSSTYSDISKRGALPQKRGDSDYEDDRFTGCKSDPLFPEKFVDPMMLKYETITPPDILAYYRGLDGDLSDVSDEDLLQAAYDWAHHVIPNGFDTWLSDTELLQLAHEWAS